jgi:hypothetical protein
MTFAVRKINVAFYLGTGAFGEAGHTSLTVTGLRIKLKTSVTAGVLPGMCDLQIYGLTPEQLSQLSALNANATITKKNTIAVTAGDEHGMTLIFCGSIMHGAIELNSQPESFLRVHAVIGGIEQLATTNAVSYSSAATDVTVIMKNFATLLGYSLENWGVTGTLSHPNFHGTLKQQIDTAGKAANIVCKLVPTGPSTGVLHIAPSAGQMGKYTEVISPDTGMVGYPSYCTDAVGVNIKCIFKPNLQLQQSVVIKSSLAVANGTWSVFNLSHDLESEMPNGNWFTYFTAAVA